MSAGRGSGESNHIARMRPLPCTLLSPRLPLFACCDVFASVARPTMAVSIVSEPTSSPHRHFLRASKVAFRGSLLPVPPPTRCSSGALAKTSATAQSVRSCCGRACTSAAENASDGAPPSKAAQCLPPSCYHHRAAQPSVHPHRSGMAAAGGATLPEALPPRPLRDHVSDGSQASLVMTWAESEAPSRSRACLRAAPVPGAHVQQDALLPGRVPAADAPVGGAVSSSLPPPVPDFAACVRMLCSMRHVCGMHCNGFHSRRFTFACA